MGRVGLPVRGVIRCCGPSRYESDCVDGEWGGCAGPRHFCTAVSFEDALEAGQIGQKPGFGRHAVKAGIALLAFNVCYVEWMAPAVCYVRTHLLGFFLLDGFGVSRVGPAGMR